MNRLRIILKENDTLKEMFLGIIFSNLVLLLIAVIVSNNKLIALLGVIEGMVIAIIYSVHMAVTIDDALNLDEKGAMAQMRKSMLVRYFGVCILVGLICYFRIGDPIFCILSCLTIKLGAYLQPTVHKFINRSKDESFMISDEDQKVEDR